MKPSMPLIALMRAFPIPLPNLAANSVKLVFRVSQSLLKRSPHALMSRPRICGTAETSALKSSKPAMNTVSIVAGSVRKSTRFVMISS